jgi:hypothetical protein
MVSARGIQGADQARTGRTPYFNEAGDNRLADYGEAPARVNPDGRIGSTGITTLDKFREFFETVSSCRGEE